MLAMTDGIYLFQISLLMSDMTGPQDYPLLETLFELIFVLKPRASAPLLRETYLKKLLHNSLGVESFGPKATRQLYQIVSDAKDSTMAQVRDPLHLVLLPDLGHQTFALLYQTLGAVSKRKYAFHDHAS